MRSHLGKGGGAEVYINGPVHMTKMAVMLKMLKTSHLYVESGSVVLQYLYKSWP